MLLKQTILFMALYFLPCIVTVAAQDSSVSTEVQNEKYLVHLVSRESPSPGTVDFRWTFLVKDKSTHAESFVQMQNLTDELQELVLVDDLLVILGHVQRFADSATLLDLSSQKEKDFIMGYGYVMELSATKKYLIYNQFRPRWTDPGGTSDVILLYDLTKSPLANRIGPEAQKMEAWEVGHPIFPQENLQKQSYREWIEDEQERHIVGLWHLWLEDDKQVVLTDRYRGARWLVVVDLSEGLEQAHIRKTVLDMAKIAEEVLVVDPTSKDPAAWLQTATKDLRIKGLAQRTAGKVVIQIEPDYLHRYQYKTLEVEVPLP